MLKIKSKGFTLIELLIVIAIIGILSSVVLVNLSSAKNRAYRASALATVSGLGTEILVCQDDSGITGGARIAGPGAAMPPLTYVCMNTAFGAAATGHTVQWPSLSNTGGYVYSSASDSAVTMLNTVDLPTPFYLYNSGGNVSIKCDWSATANLTCQ